LVQQGESLCKETEARLNRLIYKEKILGSQLEEVKSKRYKILGQVNRAEREVNQTQANINHLLMTNEELQVELRIKQNELQRNEKAC